MSWKIVFTKQAQRDAKRIARSNLRAKTEVPLEILARNPLQIPPPCEKLAGDLAGAYSRRINIRHRLVYQVYRKRTRYQSAANVDTLRLTQRARS